MRCGKGTFVNYATDSTHVMHPCNSPPPNWYNQPISPTFQELFDLSLRLEMLPKRASLILGAKMLLSGGVGGGPPLLLSLRAAVQPGEGALDGEKKRKRKSDDRSYLIGLVLVCYFLCVCVVCIW